MGRYARVARLGEVAELAGPVVLTSATTLVLGVSDTALLGHHSIEALAVAASVLPIWILCTAVVVPWGSAAQILVARRHGAGDTDGIRVLASTGLSGAAAVGVTVAITAAAAAPVIVAVTTPAGLDRRAATVMLWILLCGLPFTAVTAHVRGVLAGIGDTRSGARVAVAVAVLNVVLSSILIFGAGWGPAGSAIGSTVAVAAGAVALIPRVRRATGLEAVRARADRTVWHAVTALAVPDVVFGVISYGSDAVIAAVVAEAGTVSLAAHRVMSLAVSMVWMLVFGIGVATAVLAGQSLGAGDDRGRRAVVRAGAVLMVGASGAVALLLAALSPMLFRLVTGDAAVSATGRGVVWSLPVLAPIMSIGMVYAAQLRAAGNTKAVMSASVFSVVCVTLPAVWISSAVLHWGLTGVYLGIVAGWIARAAATRRRWRARAGTTPA
ncbi:MATE family efflux transporter [Nocardia africana]|uniref:Probable multidrug resistance protein NorM n=1 Tax=Nocardia africana TaxID=134964 RepID=A0A378WXU6_9NOCA|nr:MATE family efflux transporter [Nocardia africana]MCC3312611.1 MATE family efflux transporter [Nocardia africana]SUA46068.1 Multidrug-efflux transporter [Nocardia africana]